MARGFPHETLLRAVFNSPTTRTLIERVLGDGTLRRLYIFGRLGEVINEATPSTTSDPGSSSFPPTVPYNRRQLLDGAAVLDFKLDGVRRTEPAFVVLTRRWLVDRPLGWRTRHGRLFRDDEARVDVPEAMTDLVICGLMMRREAYSKLSAGLSPHLGGMSQLVGILYLRVTF